MELFSGIINSVSIVGVNDEDKTLGVLIVVSPEESNLVLTAYIPHCETDVLVVNSLDIEANGWNGGDDLTELELVEDGGLTSSIETDHENSHLFLANKSLPDFGEH